MHGRKYLYGIIIAATMVITACSGNDEPSSGATEPPVASPTQTTQEPSATPATPSETPSEPAGELETPAPPPPVIQPPDPCSDQEWSGGVAPRAAEPATALGSFTGARVGTHDCYDRVAFDFTGLASTSGLGYRVEYVSRVEQGGSGDPVPVKGAATLEVRLAGQMPSPGVAFESPADYSRDWPALLEVKHAGWYEGEHTFAIGVSEEVPFRVVRLENDAGKILVYIDLAHPRP